MTFPASIKDANIIDVTLSVFYILPNLLHFHLRISRRSLESHGHVVVAEQPKRSNYGAELLTFFVQFKSVLLHGYVQFGQKLIALLFA